MDILSHPFRVTPAGHLATVELGGIDHAVEAVAVTMLTGKDSRPLVPGFGVTDPTYGELDVAELQAVLDTYGPVGVGVELVAVEHPSDATTALTLNVTIDE